MEEALKEHSNVLCRYFEEVRPWSLEEVCQTWKMWVECFGLPLQAWSLDNLRKIGGQWGFVVGFDEQTIKKTSFSSAKILLETCYYQHIQGNVFYQLKGKVMTYM